MAAIPFFLGVYALHLGTTSGRKKFVFWLLFFAGVGLAIFQQFKVRASVSETERKDQFVRDTLISVLHEVQRQRPAPLSAAEQDSVQRQGLIKLLTAQYIVGQKSVSDKLLSGLETPPVDWINNQLRQMGQTWRLEEDKHRTSEVGPSTLTNLSTALVSRQSMLDKAITSSNLVCSVANEWYGGYDELKHRNMRLWEGSHGGQMPSSPAEQADLDAFLKRHKEPVDDNYRSFYHKNLQTNLLGLRRALLAAINTDVPIAVAVDYERVGDDFAMGRVCADINNLTLRYAAQLAAEQKRTVNDLLQGRLKDAPFWAH